jgi:hydroxyethylthiazole kinase-like uncharacterized protein yjeF
MGSVLLTQTQLRAVEREAEVALGAGVLMARAGKAAADWIAQRRADRKTRVLIVCGPGNNGGDGYACATALHALGYAPVVTAIAAPGTRDAAAVCAKWCAQHEVLDRLPPPETFDVIVDALFGIGLSRPPSGAFADAIDWINRQRAAGVVALDCPSGLDAGRGAWVGNVPGVRAAATITFIAGKPGLYTGAGVEACGEVCVESLGCNPWIERQENVLSLNAPSEFAAMLAPRGRDTHKGSFGRLAVVGGNVGMVGAALLAARAALRLGAGRVFVDVIGAPEFRVDPLQPELMLRALDSMERPDAIVIGCGLGRDTRAQAALRAAAALGVPLVVDADALAMLPVPNAAVITPHPLEAARLLGSSVAEVQADRVGAARRLSAQTGTVVVLKGAGSIIADGERVWINPTGGPALATAGTGDVLAGMIGALIAQGHSPRVAPLAAVWLHGAAADAFKADVGLVAGDIAPLAARELARLKSEIKSI